MPLVRVGEVSLLARSSTWFSHTLRPLTTSPSSHVFNSVCCLKFTFFCIWLYSIQLDNNSSTFNNQNTTVNNGSNGGVLFSSSPPTYHIGSNNLVQAPPSQFSIPIQPQQSVILYGSTPPNPFAFGSPPVLCPHWYFLI